MLSTGAAPEGAALGDGEGPSPLERHATSATNAAKRPSVVAPPGVRMALAYADVGGSETDNAPVFRGDRSAATSKVIPGREPVLTNLAMQAREGVARSQRVSWSTARGVRHVAGLMVLLGLTGLACGGRLAAGDPMDGGPDTRAATAPSSEPRDGDARPSASADASDGAVDASPNDPCVCTDDLVQVEGTCDFEVAGRPILCVKDVTDPTAPVTLDLFRSCIVDAPPSWTPGLSSTRIEQCDCAPGDVRRLCVAYR